VRIIIVSGRSGSGKSVCLHALEDAGFYCLDNLPVSLLPELVAHMGNHHESLALGIDARNLPADLTNFYLILSQFKEQGISCELVYLDADDVTLLKRFSETRRKHPLSTPILSLPEAIREERRLLLPITELADVRIDTTHYSVHQLRLAITSRIGAKEQALSLLIESFGFKFGVPIDSDFVFDVRCLANPFWQPELRGYSGLEAPVIDFLQEKPETQAMLDDITTLLRRWIPEFIHSHRNYLTIAIGCTGGQHRSVFIADALAKALRTDYATLQVRHRELA